LEENKPDQILQIAKAAENAGVDSIWVSETPFYWDSFAILGALAVETSQIRLGPGVTSPYIRPPHLQAMSIATLDRLSGGRAFLGIGRSLTQWYQHLLGMAPGNPVQVMEEIIGLLRQWWDPPHLAASDAGYFNIPGLKRPSGGIQENLPIYVAAVGDRMTKLAARVADGVVFAWPTFEYVASSIQKMREEAALHNKDMRDFAFMVQTGIKITPDVEEGLQEFKNNMAMIHSVPGLDNALASTKYDIAEIVANIRKCMNSEDILARGGWITEFNAHSDFQAARKVIPTGLVNEVALVGQAEDIRQRLSRYQAVGVTHMFLPGSQGLTADGYRDVLNSITPCP